MSKKLYPELPNIHPYDDPGFNQSDSDLARSQIARLLYSADPNDKILIYEKMDGVNVAVFRTGQRIMPLLRSGSLAAKSSDPNHIYFHNWVIEQYGLFISLLREGEAIHGEWLAKAQSTRYDLSRRDPFVVFDMSKNGKGRFAWSKVEDRLHNRLSLAPLLHSGKPLPLPQALAKLGKFGKYGALDPVQGLIYRLEENVRNNGFGRHVRFVYKYLIPGRKDNIYLDDNSAWNWLPGDRQ